MFWNILQVGSFLKEILWHERITNVAWIVNAGGARTCSLCLFLRRLCACKLWLNSRSPLRFYSVFLLFSQAARLPWQYEAELHIGRVGASHNRYFFLPLRAVVQILAAPHMTWRPIYCFRWVRSMRWAQIMSSLRERRLRRRRRRARRDSLALGGSLNILTGFDTTQPTAAGLPIPFQLQVTWIYSFDLLWYFGRCWFSTIAFRS